MSEAQYFTRCRNLAAAEALEHLTEAIKSDRKSDGPRIERHLQMARDAVLDALSVAAESSNR